jgi:hypothetical protein
MAGQHRRQGARWSVGGKVKTELSPHNAMKTYVEEEV